MSVISYYAILADTYLIILTLLISGINILVTLLFSMNFL